MTRKSDTRVDELSDALDGQPAPDGGWSADTTRLMAVADLVTSDARPDESFRVGTLALLMRTMDMESARGALPHGADDHPAPHVAEFDDLELGLVRLADVEALPPERAREVAERIKAATRQHTNRAL